MDSSDLLSMDIETLKEFAMDTLGLDVGGIQDRSLVIQQILAQDEELYKERGH